MIPPKARLASLVIAVTATFVANHWTPLLLAWIVVTVLLICTGILRVYLRFVLVVLLPISVMLLLVWGVITGAPPNADLGSSPRAGMIYATVVALRLAIVCGLLQLALLSIPSRLLPATMRGCGLNGDGLIVALGVFAVGPELAMRASQILTARRARGLLRGSRLSMIREFPYLIRPLFVWSVRAAVQRSAMWQQRALPWRITSQRAGSNQFSFVGGVLALVVSSGWLTVAVLCRWPVLLSYVGVISL